MEIVKRIILIFALLGLVALACTRSVSNETPHPPTPERTETFSAPPTGTHTPTPDPTPTPAPTARIHSGEKAFQYGDWEKALEEFQNAKASSSDPTIQVASLLGVGRTYLEWNDHPKAIENLESLITNFPEASQVAQAYFHLGQAYYAQSRYYESAEAYQRYLNLKPGLIDAYVLDLQADALFAAGDYFGAAQAYQSARQATSLLDHILLQMKEARSYALLGETQTALNIYDEIYYHTNNEYTRALIDLRKGQIYTSIGDLEQAYAAYLDAVYNYPTSYDSYSALIALVEANVEVDELSRGLVDYYAAQYGVALAAFDRYLQEENPADLLVPREALDG